MIDRATIQRILDAADIVDVVKDFVTLKKAGVNYKGLCPFHNEKTPSFIVSPAKQLCKCFSCGKGGGVVHFVMEHEQMTYPEALRWLARRYGIEIKERELTDDERQAASLRESMFAINAWAAEYYEHQLHDDVDGVAYGMAYLRSRGFRDDIIRKFRLGFSPTALDAIVKAATARGFSRQMLEKTGICYSTEDGRLIDRYHGRVIFPVHTVSGSIVAFGGRILSSDKKLAKYVNSPESEIYSKSRELYGLYLAKHAIAKADCCYLVEGYTDVISMHQCGIENVVASSGTSLTEGQIRLLHRFTSNITVLYDGDAAGIKASLRGIDMLLAEGLNVKVLLLPDGDDPDSFARGRTASEYRAYIEANQVDFIRFKTRLLLSDATDDPIRRAALIDDIVTSIAVIPSDVVRQMYGAECARLLSVSEELIMNEVAKKRVNGTTPPQRAETQQAGEEAVSHEVSAESSAPSTSELQPKSTAISRSETLLLTAIVRHGASPLCPAPSMPPVSVATYIAADLAADGLTLKSEDGRKLLAETAAMPIGTNSLQLLMSHPDAAISNLASRLGTDAYHLSPLLSQGYTPEAERLDEIIPRLLHDYKHAVVKTRMQQLLSDLQKAETQADPTLSRDIMSQYAALAAIERQLAAVLGDRVING